jgi:hypothetical protein
MSTSDSRTPADVVPDLGDLIDVYRGSYFQQLLCGIGGLAFVCIGCLPLVVGSYVLPNHLAFRVLEILLGLFLIAIGSLALWGAVFYFGRLRALVYEQGFVLKNGRSIQTFRWEELQPVELTETTHIRNGQVSHYTHTFRIRAWDGREVFLEDTDYSSGEDLGRTIMREVQRRALKNLLQQALRLESAGEWSQALVAFEKLLKESPYNEIADQARDHVQRIREKAG